MHSYTLATVLVSASLASSVWGSNINIPRALQVRQGGDAFIPGTRQGTSDTCIGSFGPNSKLCANSGVCYDSSIGDSCCSEGYPCGSGSFCLVKGYCCPDGDSPVDCAAANGITLPADFKTAAPTPKSISSALPISSSTPVAVTTSSSAAVVPSSSAAVVVPSSSAAPFPIPSKATTTPAASGTISATGAPRGTSTLTPFKGAASPKVVVSGGGLAAFLAGIVAALL
ncbi:hypothetical protein MMC07_002719 [Pseudocyphellaria aurata]|nr:hypothetical protein [Pseudocyphellaria aurata]